MGPAASGRRLCDIVRILFTVTKSAVKNLGSPCMTKIYPLSSKPKDPSYRYAFVVPGLPNFLTNVLLTLNNTLSISQSLLANGPA